jgi:cytochrome c
MRKLILVGPVLFALAACGGSEPEATPTDAGSESTEVAQTEAAPAEAAAPNGEAEFAVCKACHKVEKGAPNGVGPNLHGVVGRAVASVPGFAYSPAMKAKGGNWDEAALDAYLAAPSKIGPGTKMAFAGVSDAAKRKALIEYLKAQK